MELLIDDRIWVKNDMEVNLRKWWYNLGPRFNLSTDVIEIFNKSRASVLQFYHFLVIFQIWSWTYDQFLADHALLTELHRLLIFISKSLHPVGCDNAMYLYPGCIEMPIFAGLLKPSCSQTLITSCPPKPVINQDVLHLLN